MVVEAGTANSAMAVETGDTSAAGQVERAGHFFAAAVGCFFFLLSLYSFVASQATPSDGFPAIAWILV